MTASEIRQAMGSEFCAIADALRAEFGAATKIAWIRSESVKAGERIDSEPIGEKAWAAQRKER